MDKIKFNAFGAFPEVETKYLQIGETTLEVVPVIPYEEVFNMIQWCIDYIINDRPFLSAPLKRVIKDFAVLKFYTNLDFGFLDDAKDVVSIYSEYDFVRRFEVMEKVLPLVNEGQLKFFDETLDETLESITSYRNSAQGIIETLAADADYNSSRMEQAMKFLGDDKQMAQIGKLLDYANHLK